MIKTMNLVLKPNIDAVNRFKLQTRCWQFQFKNSTIARGPTLRMCSGATNSSGVVGQESDVFALDFDGVICDSVGESSISAWEGATQLWPDLLEKDNVQQVKEETIKKLKIVRPIVETGFENLLLIRALADGADPDHVLEAWPTGMMKECLEQSGYERSKLVDHFGAVRDEWMGRDMKSWLHTNALFEGIVPAMQQAKKDSFVYIVTTKQERFVQTLLEELGNCKWDPNFTRSTTQSGIPKHEVLSWINEAHVGTTGSYHFVEDKIGTLELVADCPGLWYWNLYLVDYGYSTAEERERAAANERIKVISQQQFIDLLSVRPNKGQNE